jgi:putative flippase GtrA
MRLFLFSKIRENFILIKYVLTSASVYIYILGALFILVDLLSLNKVLAYVLVYATAYILEYTITLRFVFKEQHRWLKVIKFITYVAVFLLISTLLFKLFLSFNIYYLIATLLVALLLMPVRFFVNKYWVYR